MAKHNDNWLPKYIHDYIWNVRLEDRNAMTAFFLKQVRIILIVLRNYAKDNLQLQAAGLTFYTLLSVVPLVALAFAVAKGFGFQEALESQLTSAFSGHEEVVDQVMTFSGRMLENTKGGLLAGIGVVILLWTVMRLLVRIEMSFNDIWKVAKGRTWLRRFTEYFSIMLFAPVIVILAGSITVVISQELENLIAGYDFLLSVGPVLHFGIKMIPYTLIWLLFTFVYMVMPNTKVKFKSALIAGIIAGTSFQFLEWGYINFQVGVSKYNAIYGSFAALPLFLIWVNISWLMTLIGAEIAYANQYVSEIENEVDGDRLSNSQRHVIALMLMKRIAAAFDRGDEPFSAQDLSGAMDLPYGVTSRILDLMVEAKLLSEIEHSNKEASSYLPHKSTEKLYVDDIMKAIDLVGFTEIPRLKDSDYNEYFLKYNALREAMNDAPQNLLVRELPDLHISKS
ncbi:MAG: YihY/virulence factor BrkB family protein [Cryomorphaceae bacterium]